MCLSVCICVCIQHDLVRGCARAFIVRVCVCVFGSGMWFEIYKLWSVRHNMGLCVLACMRVCCLSIFSSLHHIFCSASHEPILHRWRSQGACMIRGTASTREQRTQHTQTHSLHAYTLKIIRSICASVRVNPKDVIWRNSHCCCVVCMLFHNDIL